MYVSKNNSFPLSRREATLREATLREGLETAEYARSDQCLSSQYYYHMG